MRHALRTAIIATPVLGWSMVDGSPYARWAVFTLILCQPYFSATWLRSAERVVGTALGALVAAGIGLISKTPVELAFTMLPLTIFAFAIRSVSYTAYIAVLTPMIVLLIEQIAPGNSEFSIAISRIGYTLLGGVLAILGNLLLWPGFERGRLDGSIATAIRAHIDYVHAVFDALLADQPAPAAPRRAPRAWPATILKPHFRARCWSRIGGRIAPSNVARWWMPRFGAWPAGFPCSRSTAPPSPRPSGRSGRRGRAGSRIASPITAASGRNCPPVPVPKP